MSDDHIKINAFGIEIDLIEVGPGHFTMGSPNASYYEAPPHKVTLRSRRQIGKFPITQEQWAAVMGDSPSAHRGDSDHPVETVTWGRAMEFCRRLGERCGSAIRLPSEAEWEYACRAGSVGDFHFDPRGPFAHPIDIPLEIRDTLAEYAWFDLNSGDRTHPIGRKRPNRWGFHDMLGNVWEWCADEWYPNHKGATGDAEPRISAHGREQRRVLRGGAWDMDAFRCRSSYRSFDPSDNATSRIGFRIARVSGDRGS